MLRLQVYTRLEAHHAVVSQEEAGCPELSRTVEADGDGVAGMVA